MAGPQGNDPDDSIASIVNPRLRAPITILGPEEKANKPKFKIEITVDKPPRSIQA